MIGPMPPPGFRKNKQQHVSRSVEQPKELCKNCFGLFSSIENLRSLVSKERLPVLYSDLTHGQNLGCPICSINVQQILTYAREPDKYYLRSAQLHKPQEKFNEDIKYPSEILGIEAVTLEFETPPKGNSGVVGLPITVRCPLDDMAAEFLQSLPFPYPMSGDLYIQAAMKQLERCKTKHDDCPRFEQNHLPTRVLDVMATESVDNLRLYESKPSQRDPYIALSYCWGRDTQFTTTQATYQHNLDGIPLGALSKTLQEAVVITRKLKTRYLWIDAICIIQDSSEDKSKEISQMGNVYSMATTTICASNASSAKDGFLSFQIPAIEHKVPFLLPNGTLGNISILENKEEGQSMPLEKRAWTFQESMLSPRLLVFGRGEVIWMCRSSKGNLCSDSAVSVHSQPPLPSSFHGNREYSLLAKNVMSSGEQNNHLQTRIEFWKYVMSDYSLRHITIASDRIPALVGIATYLQDAWQDTYLAGHWESCLIYHLAWQSSNNQLESYDTATYIAPSWSWLSSTGNFMTILDLDVIDAQVISCDVVPRDPNLELGNLKDGRLVLKAVMIDDLQVVREYNKFARYWFDFKDRVKYLRHVVEDTMIDSRWLGTSAYVHDETLRISYLRLGWSSGKDAIGLILLGVGDDKWRRIGRFSAHSFRPDLISENGERKIITII